MSDSEGTKRSSGPVRSQDADGFELPPEDAFDRTTRDEAAPGDEPQVPWGYGVDRVTAMPVDPERLFVYWEITDPAIDEARGRLGSSGSDATLVLRVYDVTGRIFDGTNAHAQFDQAIDRSDRQWFFQIGKPCSDAIVELGLKSRGSEFVRLARSGRAEFPRRTAPEPRTPRWLTVRDRDGRAGSTPTPEPVSTEGSRVQAAHPVHPKPDDRPTTERIAPVPRAVSPAETVPARREEVPIRSWTEEMRQVHRDGAWTTDSWESGPHTTELAVPAPSRERFGGGVQVYRRGPTTHAVDGPWEVVIRGLGAHRRRKVLARWEMRRCWTTEEGHEVLGSAPADGALKAGSSQALGLGASERHWAAGSEWRLAGASELLYFGASERRIGGASERSFRSASESLVRGASEQRLGGASERRFRGGSERRLESVGEQRRGGASEGRLRGASDDRPAPAKQSAYPLIEDETESS